MISRRQRNNALAVLVAASRRYGDKSFRVDVAGPNYRPLRDAESLGWVWFMSRDRAALTQAGLAEAGGYQVVPSVVSYVCQVCLSVVPQEGDATGLPVNTPCPKCAETTAQAVQRLRQEAE